MLPHPFAILVLFVALLLFPSPTNAQSTSLLDTANALTLVAHSADLATTARCIGAGTCAESNPILRPFVAHPPKFFALKMGTAFGSWWIKNRLKSRHPRLVLTLAIAESVAFSAIAYHNHKVSTR